MSIGPGAVTISIDVELAWGNWDNLTQDQLARVDQQERPIIARLCDIFERHDVPVSWCIVAALLDWKSAVSQPGGEHCWYAPDVVEMITRSSVQHDIGSHGGRHIYFDSISDDEAEGDLGFAREIHRQNNLDFTSFVFPRNRVAKKEMIAQHGVRVFRGEDCAWHQRIRNRHLAAGRVANLVDKMLPIAPEVVHPTPDGSMINLPGSMLFMSRNGLRRLGLGRVMHEKLNKGLAHLSRGGVFHLWFHPCNFYHQTDSQFATFERFVGKVADLVSLGELMVQPMAGFARQ